MSNRDYQPLKTQGRGHVEFGLTLIGAGAAAPTLGEGDVSAAAPSYFNATVTRASQGQYTLVMLDPFLALVSVTGNYAAATITVPWLVQFGLPTQSATTYCWSIPISIYSTTSVVVTDIVASDKVFLKIIGRNSLVLP